jgi:RND family efflux transporter MFP subunit
MIRKWLTHRFGWRDELLFSRHEILESELDEQLAAERREHATAAGRLGSRLAATELELLAIARREAERAIAEAREGLAAVEIAAPHDGVVVLQRDWRGTPVRVGDTLWPGQPVAEIPSLDAVEAEVFVLEADAGGLAVGRPATVTIDAHPERSYPARVRRVEALAKPQVPGSPVQYFAVTLAFDQPPAPGLAPGQRLHATLELARVDDALVVPRQAVFDDGAGKRVFRLAAGGFEPVAVTLGPSGLGRVVIASGVSEGDELALVDPGRPEGGRASEGDAMAGGGGTAPAVPGG